MHARFRWAEMVDPPADGANRPIYELSNYIVLSRILHYVPYLSPIHPGRVITTFIGISAVVEALTANGAAQAANSNHSASAISIGHALLKAALILQLFVLILFISVAARFQYNCAGAGFLNKGTESRSKLMGLLITLYISSALILCRTVYRTAEYFEAAKIVVPADGVGFDPNSISPIIRYEWFFWVFEASLMLVNSFLINVRHPGKYLPRSNKIYLGMDGVEKEGKEFKDARNWFAKAFDPFDIAGLVNGRGKEKWWEDDMPVDVESLPASQKPHLLTRGDMCSSHWG